MEILAKSRLRDDPTICSLHHRTTCTSLLLLTESGGYWQDRYSCTPFYRGGKPANWEQSSELTPGLLLPSQLFPGKPCVSSKGGIRPLGALGERALDSNSEGGHLAANNRNPLKRTPKRGPLRRLLGELTKSNGKLRMRRNQAAQ